MSTTFSQPWFSTASRVAALQAAVQAWLGTPFCLHAQALGAGVDCVHLVHALAQAAGWPHPITPPAYTAAETMHRAESKLHEYLDAAAGIELVNDWPTAAGEVIAGDLVTFTIGRAPHHLGMALGRGQFVHVMTGHKVHISSLIDPTYAKRAARLYRLVDESAEIAAGGER